MRRKYLTRTALGVGVLALGILSGCDREGGPGGPPPVPVVTGQADVETVQLHAELIGRLNGSANVEVRARVSGFVEEVNFIEGQKVAKGDVLLKIDPRPFEAALAKAEADVARAVAMQVRAEDDERRQSRLFETKTISEQEYQNAVQANLAAKADVEAARAASRQAQLDLEFATVTAPIAGVIGRTDFTVGDFIPAGSSGVAVATLSTLDPVDFEFAISEFDYLMGAREINTFLEMPEAERPRNVVLILGDDNEFPEPGWVLAVDRGLDQTTGTIAGKARFPNPGGVLRPGQFARARFKTRELPEAVTISERALGDMQGQAFVWVVDTDDRVSRRPVEVAKRLDGRAVIADGLKGGERVVVEGGMAMSEGRKVAEAPPAQPAKEPQPPGRDEADGATSHPAGAGE